MNSEQNFDEIGPPLVLDAILELQFRLRNVLAEDYVKFLLNYNGGRPDLYKFRITTRPDYDEGLVQIFFGIGRKSAVTNILWNVDVFAGRIPEWLLPIGREDGGNLICLSRKDAGVYYWDHDKEGERVENNTFLIEAKWSIFLANFY
jgi:hypothetical protein